MNDEGICFLARARLRKVDQIPDDGWHEPRLEIELTSDEKLRSAWAAEIRVLGMLPWRRGEEREVELRILSCAFQDYVAFRRPDLFLCQNRAIIGDLSFDEQGVPRRNGRAAVYLASRPER